MQKSKLKVEQSETQKMNTLNDDSFYIKYSFYNYIVYNSLQYNRKNNNYDNYSCFFQIGLYSKFCPYTLLIMYFIFCCFYKSKYFKMFQLKLAIP